MILHGIFDLCFLNFEGGELDVLNVLEGPLLGQVKLLVGALFRIITEGIRSGEVESKKSALACSDD